MRGFNRKYVYFLIGCFSFAFLVIGATYAYFTASTSNNNVVHGSSDTVTFNLAVERVTTVDMAYGLVPMRNKQAPNAAVQGCYDDHGNAGCQMYKITVNADSDMVMFLDGYIIITPKDERLETRFTNVYLGKDGVYRTAFTNEEYASDTFIEDAYIKNGIRGGLEDAPLNNTDDYGCLLIKNEQIGGEIGKKKEFYMMIWVYDNGMAQDYLQGMQLAYSGNVTFVTAEGNQISASFD